MTPDNDPYSPNSELIRLTGQARFLISALRNYGDDPTEGKWFCVLEGMETLREMTDDIWARYMAQGGDE